ncbi:hypothetical protein TNIN_107111 [Trichonephila inaurata madagascariensis]|uniref:Uncharacterized protein n=1 Tax=Trichonephila inaurata madagascariensis TaxID=2747483 RepID=A0A8X7CSN0_9ARAC|nr:hypothetical protein TNIN_107111 [Trichonephila inaurata madagascariensis]
MCSRYLFVDNYDIPYRTAVVEDILESDDIQHFDYPPRLLDPSSCRNQEHIKKKLKVKDYTAEKDYESPSYCILINESLEILKFEMNVLNSPLQVGMQKIQHYEVIKR